ncbi:MAG: YoaK family protein [Hyphomicrobiaceae bacterium]
MTIAARQSNDHDDAFRLVIPPMLSFVSGYVDTTGFLGFSGLLTSQVTGSFVAAGAAFVRPEPGLAAKLLAIPMFMVGAVVMTLLVAGLRRRKHDPMPAALVMVAVLIGLFLILAVAGGDVTTADTPLALAAAILAFVAMGAQSALVRGLFKGSVPANFMTGNVTQVAVETTDLLLARAGFLNSDDAAADAARVKAASAQLKILVPTIACFVLGATISAHAFIAIGFWSLLLATGLVLAAALWSWKAG